MQDPRLTSRKRPRPVRLVGQFPASAVRGVALTDGVSFFEILERRNRTDGPWLNLRNMELGADGWFALRDCEELRLAGNAEHIRTEKGFPRP